MSSAVHAVCLTVMFLILVAQLLRPSYRDAVVFAILFALMLIGSRWTLPLPEVRLPGRARRTATVAAEVIGPVVALASAFLLVFTPRFGVVDFVVVGALGLVAVGAAWGQRDDLGPTLDTLDSAERPPLRRAAFVWITLLVSLGLWELYAFLSAHLGVVDPPPAVSDLIDPLIDEPVSRAAFVVVWLAGGWALARSARNAGRR